MFLRTLMFFAVCAIVFAHPIENEKNNRAENSQWWKTAVFYQIYPRSFKDDNNDGVGDLKGIISKLEHVKDAGVTSAWLSPIFKSPMDDAGYDISDFRDIDPIFGTMADFDELLKKAKNLGIKIVLDFVPNHSSDEHEWFGKSVRREGKYTNYYVWHDGKKLANGTRVPPNNWISEFHGSAWEWNEQRQQYYLHQFSKKQPDLNYRDPNVVQEMKDVLIFWLEKGVDGFRVDTIPSLFESDKFPDEPLSNDPNALPTDYNYLNHIYTKDLPETIDMVVQWRQVLDEFSQKTDKIDRVLMLEVYSPIPKVMDYYGNDTHPAGHFPFNFRFIEDVNGTSDAYQYHKTIHAWMDNLPKGRTPNWVFGNHDRHRTATRYSKELVDGLNMFTMILPGVGVTYNGEEIGMEDGKVSWEETQDPNGLNAGPDRYQLFTRDPERTPFHWDNTTNAGFNRGHKTWLPVSEKYKENNLKKQVESKKSNYKVYQALMKLRKDHVLEEGDYFSTAVNENILIVARYHEDSQYVLVLNVGKKVETVNVQSAVTATKIPNKLKAVLTSNNSSIAEGTIVDSKSIAVKPNEAYILTSEI